MDDIDDDGWVREFNVSNPQKTHAGYTVYRVSSKVYPKGFPEAASEVIVFKRYSEIRSLYKQLKIIYEHKSGQKKQFPHLNKAHFFSRFDESVIEERQKQALLLLNFAGNVSFLFTSQQFVKFFEGGVEHTSQGSSRDSSESDLHQNHDEQTKEDSTEMEPWVPQSYFTEDLENIDINSSDDETFKTNKELDSSELSVQLNDKISTDTSTPVDSSKKKWLAQAMSLCSEGDDIETLASEAGCGESGKQGGNDSEVFEASEPERIKSKSSQQSQGSVDLLPILLESSEDEVGNEDVFVEIVSSNGEKHFSSSASQSEDFTFDEKRDASDYLPLESESMNSRTHVDGVYIYVKSLDSVKCDQDEDMTQSQQPITIPKNLESQENDDNAGKPMQNKKERRQVGRIVSNIGMSWIDPTKKDYLYQAAQIIQEALYCEANEFYEDAFNKYKICVGILLKGVQQDSNSKRREAVRRKTAQYLVKAEFLFNTYLKIEDDLSKADLSVKSQNSSEVLPAQNIVDRQFSQVTLRSLKVIGVIGKVMLVECQGVEGVFVVKVLHKTNAVHRNARQESKQHNKNMSKKYVKSSYMVQLHRHFDTSNSIFLILDFASSGTLWDHVNNLRKPFTTSDEVASIESTSEVTSVEEGEKGQAMQSNGVSTNENIADTERPSCHKENSHPSETFKSNVLIPSNDSRQSVEISGESSVNGKKSLGKKIKDETSKEEHSLRHVADLSKSNDNLKAIDGCSVYSTNLNQIIIGSEENRDDDSLTPSGDVLCHLDHVTKPNSVPEDCVRVWIAELLLAIASVHSCGIILRDLKPPNVLLNDHGHVLLSYFGVWEEVDHSVDPDAVEQLYCAPEITFGEKISFAADWWSLGVLSFELITGKSLATTHPWGIHPHTSIDFPSDSISTEARSFLTGLICHNSAERLGSGIGGVEEIKSHAFFKGVDWDELSLRS